MVSPDEVLSFWLDDVGEKGWYAQSDTLDKTIRDRFGEAWQRARERGGAYFGW